MSICLLSMNIGASASQDRSGTLSLTGTSIVLCVVDGVSNYVQLVKDPQVRQAPGTPAGTWR